MKKIYFLAFLLLFYPTISQAKTNIFACEPEWESLAKEIGGELLETFSATSAKQDPHYIRARPSLIAKIRKADLLICSGADLEVGWLPILLQKAPANLQVGQVGHLMAANFVNTLGVPTVIDRAMGDVHPMGNPHIHLDPRNILLVALELKNRLIKIDPENEAKYQKNYRIFVNNWNLALKKWQNQAKDLRGLKVVSHHQSFNYLINWLELDEVGVLEAKPGIAPSVSHLRNLLKILQQDPANVIIRTPFDPNNSSKWLANKTQMKQLILPFTVDKKQNRNLFELFEQIITSLKETL